MKRERCVMEGCDREVKHKAAGLCNRCYHFIYYWKNKSVTQLMKRRTTIKFWEARMEQYVSERRGSTRLRRVK